MPSTLRGADIVVRTLERAGHTDIFTLSGNHIMSLFDAAIETKLTLMHVRHEAATVHMADAYGRLTGRPGIAWVTGGPGHANAVGALFTALGQETPMVLLSGHTETDQLGRGGFQELRQVEMAAPVCKAAWMATDTATVGMDVAKAIRLATSGRPGPVHLSLPSDVLDAAVPEDAVAWPVDADFTAPAIPLGDAAADAVLALLATAQRPLVIGAPVLATAKGRDLLRRIESALTIPTCLSEGPRGFNDASLGAYARGRETHRHGAAAGKSPRFHLEVRRRTVPAGLSFHCHRSGWGDPGSSRPVPGPGVRLRRRHLSGGGGPDRARPFSFRHGVAGGGAVLLRRPAGGMGRSGIENPGDAASGAGIPDLATVP